MTISLATLEDAARAGADAIEEAIEVLLDDLEARGELGVDEAIERTRAELLRIGGVQRAIWANCPEAVIADFHARTLAMAALDRARARWRDQLDARGPWLRALRPIETSPGLEAALRSEGALDLSRWPRPRFCGEDQVLFEARPHLQSEECWRWTWTEGRVAVEAREPSMKANEYPRFIRGESAPLLQRDASSEPVQLPWPEFGSAEACFGSKGREIYVFGWVEDYEGLVYVLDANTLELLRSKEFADPVTAVLERPGSDDLLIATYRELSIWGGSSWRLRVKSPALACSPSGRLVCVVEGSSAQIWDLGVTPADPPDPGLPPTFSPEGDRLVDGSALLDGRSGARLARLSIQLGNYLEGGPARPWYHVGTDWIVCIHGGLACWSTRSGAQQKLEDQTPGVSIVPHWYCIAYDRSGAYFARARRGANEVSIVGLPSAKVVATLDFDAPVQLLALAPAAELVGVLGGGRVEVRQLDGTRVFVGEYTGEAESEDSLRFSPDASALIFDRDAHPTQTWALEDGTIQNERDAWPHPRWSLTPGPISFLSYEDGVRLAILSTGPIVANPSEPRIFAYPGGLFELRG